MFWIGIGVTLLAAIVVLALILAKRPGNDLSIPENAKEP